MITGAILTVSEDLPHAKSVPLEPPPDLGSAQVHNQPITFDVTVEANGGLTITPELKTQLDTTNSLLQALIDIISGTPVNEPGNGAPSALQSALAAAITNESLGTYDNIENEDVKH